jgi:regulatory protein
MKRKITALEPQQRNPRRVSVFLEGEYAFGLSRITAAWLEVGQELGPEDVQRLQNNEVKESAVQAALHLINYKPRTEAEIRQRLEKKGFDPAVTGETIEHLRTSGLLDDRRFAGDWVDNQTEFRPRGRRLLQYELRYKGLDDEVIQEALEKAAGEDDLAYQAGIRKAQLLSRLERSEFRLKLIQYLARRGFSYGVAAGAVNRLWEETHSESGNEE